MDSGLWTVCVCGLWNTKQTAGGHYEYFLLDIVAVVDVVVVVLCVQPSIHLINTIFGFANHFLSHF